LEPESSPSTNVSSSQTEQVEFIDRKQEALLLRAFTCAEDWEVINEPVLSPCVDPSTGDCKSAGPGSYIIGQAILSDGTTYPIGMPCPRGCSEKEWSELVMKYRNKPWYDEAFIEAIGVKLEDFIDLDLYRKMKLEEESKVKIDVDLFFSETAYNKALLAAQPGEKINKADFYDMQAYQEAIIKAKDEVNIDLRLIIKLDELTAEIERISKTPLYKLWEKKYECEATDRIEYYAFVKWRGVLFPGFIGTFGFCMFIGFFFGTYFI
jgi:hypothetical protein